MGESLNRWLARNVPYTVVAILVVYAFADMINHVGTFTDVIGTLSDRELLERTALLVATNAMVLLILVLWVALDALSSVRNLTEKLYLKLRNVLADDGDGS